jgi:mannose-6-phosphate isomerase
MGKTEAWHVLAADPSARLAMGLRPGVAGERFAAACRAGERTAPLLRWLPARPGTTFLVPAGTVHALGAGCLVYEVQQPSEITYRLDDWGRLDDTGRPRPLHVEAGLACLAAASRPEPVAPVVLRSPVGRRHLLVTCAYFALERIALAAGEVAPARAAGSPQTLTCLRGAVAVETAGGVMALGTGETAVLCATTSTARLRAAAPAVVFRAWVPEAEGGPAGG